MEAWTQGNLQDLLSLLSEDVTFWSDGSGKVTATLKPLHSPRKIARFLLAILCSKKRSTLAFKLADINGQPGILNYVDGHLQSVWTFDIFDGRLYTIYSVLNPNKLVRLKAEG